MQRRSFLTAAVTGVAALRPDSNHRAMAASKFVEGRKSEDVARDEDYWREIQEAFTIDRNIINLNNGGVCPSPKVVQEAMRRALDFANAAPAYNLWTVLEPAVESVRQRLANMFGSDAEEIAITRNASEALEIAQMGIELKRGDEVLTTDQDYGRMLTTWRQRERREGIVMKQISFPVPPPSMDDLYQRFERAITPKTKVILMCHITNLTGQIFPVKKISQMARQRGILTIVDGAHAFAHFPYKYSDLECDYYGSSLHKWMLAPHGTGFLFVRKDKIASTWPLMAADVTQDDNIRKFEEIGTHPAANHNAIAEAITFHDGIGADRKLARLRYLRSVWSERLLQIPGVSIPTSSDPAQSGGLALVSFAGKRPGPICEELWKRYRVLATGIEHKDFQGIRVTPNVYTTLSELDVFSTGVEKILKS